MSTAAVPTNNTEAAALASLIAMEAQFVSQNRQNLMNICYTEQLPAGANSVRLNVEANKVAVETADGSPIPLQKGAFSGVVFTPVPKATDREIFTDMAAYISGRTNLSVVTAMADSVLTKQNKDIIAAIKATGDDLGSITTELTLDLVEEAAAELGDANATGEKFMLTTFEGWRHLLADLKASGADILSDTAKDAILRGVVAEANVGALMGFTPLVVPASVAGVGNFVAFTEKRGIGFVYSELMDVKAGGYDDARRGTPFSIRSVYDVKAYMANFVRRYTLKPKAVSGS
jgi:hypothetical protein